MSTQTMPQFDGDPGLIIKDGVLIKYEGHEPHVTIPEGVTDTVHGQPQDAKPAAMDKAAFMEALSAAIVNNSNLEADGDDSKLFDNIASVIRVDGDLVVSFYQGAALRLTAQPLCGDGGKEADHG